MRGSRVRVPLVALFSIPKHKHYTEISEISTSVVHGLPKPVRRVRLPYLAPPSYFNLLFLFSIFYSLSFILSISSSFILYFSSTISSHTFHLHIYHVVTSWRFCCRDGIFYFVAMAFLRHRLGKTLPSGGQYH